MDQDQLLSRRSSEYRKVRFANQSTDYFFIAVVIVFFLTLLSWGGIYVYNRTLTRDVANFRTQIGLIETELREAFGDNNLVLLSEKIATAKQLLANHAIGSKVFVLLESQTLPKVAFSSFNYSHDARQVTMAATAANYQVLADQIGIFESMPQIERVEFGGLSLAEGNVVGFSLILVFNQSILQLSTQTQ